MAAVQLGYVSVKRQMAYYPVSARGYGPPGVAFVYVDDELCDQFGGESRRWMRRRVPVGTKLMVRLITHDDDTGFEAVLVFTVTGDEDDVNVESVGPGLPEPDPETGRIEGAGHVYGVEVTGAVLISCQHSTFAVGALSAV